MTDKTPSLRAAGLITVELGATLKTDWVEWCKAQHLIPGKVVKRLVERALEEGLELTTKGEGRRIVVKVVHEVDTGPKVGREIYFTPSEFQAASTAADAQGFGFHDWVIAAVRAALIQAPSFGQSEITELVKSNLMLVQVVSELSALRRASTDADVRDQIEALEGSIKKHVEAVSTAISQGAKRWLLKV